MGQEIISREVENVQLHAQHHAKYTSYAEESICSFFHQNRPMHAAHFPPHNPTPLPRCHGWTNQTNLSGAEPEKSSRPRIAQEDNTRIDFSVLSSLSGITQRTPADDFIRLSSVSLFFNIRRASVNDLRVVRVDLPDQTLLLELPDRSPCQRTVDFKALDQSRSGDELHLTCMQTKTGLTRADIKRRDEMVRYKEA